MHLLRNLLFGSVLAATTFSAAAAYDISRVTFSTGSVGGSTYTWAAMASNVLSQHIDGVTFSSRSGGTTENVLLVEQGEITAATILSTDYWSAKQGADPTAESTDLRVLWYMFPTYVTFVVPKDDPASTVQEMKGKRMSVGARDGGVWVMWQIIKGPLGLKDEDFDLVYLGSGASATAFKDGQIDAFMSQGGLPFPPLVEIAQSDRGAKIVLFSEEELANVEASTRLVKRGKVEPGLLPGVDHEIDTLTTGVFVVVNKDFPEDLAYEIAKALDANYEELKTAYKAAAHSTAENTAANDYIPLHPGTRKYLVEKGLLSQ